MIDNSKKRHPRLLRLQLGLRGFLLLCTAIGATVGIYLRASLEKEPNGGLQLWQLDGFTIYTRWNGQSDKRTLGYLLAFPDFGPNDSEHSLRLSGRGVFLVGEPKETAFHSRNLLASRPGCKYWVGVAVPELGVRPIEGSFPRVPLLDYDAFENSVLYNEYIRPALIEESQRFDRWWFDKYGTQNPKSRFTTQATWDAWIAERDVKSAKGELSLPKSK